MLRILIFYQAAKKLLPFEGDIHFIDSFLQVFSTGGLNTCFIEVSTITLQHLSRKTEGLGPLMS
jgi:hypothetical protein